VCGLYSANPALTLPSICNKKVFVTSAAYSIAQLGGLAGANARCAESAVAAGLPGVFNAWISNNTIAAKSNAFTGAASGSTLYQRLDGVVVSDKTSFMAATISNPINVTENGTVLNNATVWTNTGPTGGIGFSSNVPHSNCQNWTSSSPFDVVFGGNSSSTSVTWTWANRLVCNTSQHLYCVQQ